MGRDAPLLRMLFCFTNRKLACTLRPRCFQKGCSVWFTVKSSLVKLAHSSFRAEWNTGELCWSVLLCEMCRQQCCTFVRLVISPSSGVYIRGFLCHVMVSWLRSFLLRYSAAHSSLLPGLKSCCAQENKRGVRNPQCRNLHTGGVQLLCLFFSEANIIGEELQSLCIFLFEEFKAEKQALFSKVELHNFISDQSICLPLLIQCEHSLPSQSY